MRELFWVTIKDGIVLYSDPIIMVLRVAPEVICVTFCLTQMLNQLCNKTVQTASVPIYEILTLQK